MKELKKIDTELMEKMKTKSLESDRSANPIDQLLKIKIYNAAPNEIADISKAGQILIKEGEYFQPMGKEIEFNLLTVKKVLGGRYPLRDEIGALVKIGGETQYGFAFTEEMQDQYFRNTEEVFFKNKEGTIKMELGELKKMLKTKEINSIRNPFYKEGKTIDDESYDSSWVSQSYMLYGIFTSGENIGELFRLQLSTSNYGNTYKDGQQVDAEKGTLLDAVKQGEIEANEANGFMPARHFMNIKMSVKEDGKFFKANFEFKGLIDFDNESQNELLHSILAEAKEYNFGKDRQNVVLENKPSNILTPTVSSLNEALGEKREVHEKLVKKVDEEISVDTIPF